MPFSHVRAKNEGRIRFSWTCDLPLVGARVKCAILSRKPIAIPSTVTYLHTQNSVRHTQNSVRAENNGNLNSKKDLILWRMWYAS